MAQKNCVNLTPKSCSCFSCRHNSPMTLRKLRGQDNGKLRTVYRTALRQYAVSLDADDFIEPITRGKMRG